MSSDTSSRSEPLTRDEVALETLAITAGRRASGASLAPALWASSTWEADGLDDAHRRATTIRHDGFYSRYSNPTVRSFEDAMAELEGAEAALAFASGMGAIASTVFALCSSGSHIVAQRQLYAGTLALLQGPCRRMGIDVTFVDVATPGAFAAAVQPGRTMLVLAETPSNPLLELADLADERRKSLLRGDQGALDDLAAELNEVRDVAARTQRYHPEAADDYEPPTGTPHR